MPNLFVYVNVEDANRIKPLIEIIGLELRNATSDALPNIQPENVAVMVIPFIAADNMTRVQVLGIASYSPEREEYLGTWTDKLRDAVEKMRLMPELAEIHDILREAVDAWPVMPVGNWGFIPPFWET